MTESRKPRVVEIVVIVALLAFGLFGICVIIGVIGAASGGGSSSRSSGSYDVWYKVEGSGPADMTYRNASGDTEQDTVRLPWSKRFSARRGAFLYVSAQTNSGEDSATIACTITANGSTVARANSRGAYHIATCSARAGD